MYKQFFGKLHKYYTQVRHLKTYVSDSELIVRTIKRNLDNYSEITFFHIGTRDGNLGAKLINSGF